MKSESKDCKTQLMDVLTEIAEHCVVTRFGRLKLAQNNSNATSVVVSLHAYPRMLKTDRYARRIAVGAFAARLLEAGGRRILADEAMTKDQPVTLYAAEFPVSQKTVEALRRNLIKPPVRKAQVMRTAARLVQDRVPS